MDMYRECGNAALVCRHFGIAPKTFWRWKKRYDPWELKSLENKSRRPKGMPRKTPWEVERRVLKLKREHPRWGREKLAYYLKKHENVVLSSRTCGRILKRHELVVPYKTRKRKPPKPRIDWSKVHVPGDLIQVDTKFLSMHGKRFYQYTLIDVVSRWRYVDHSWNKDMKTTNKFLQNAQKAADFTFRTMQTDNGSEFGQSVTKWCKDHDIHHVFTHKRRPTENAYVERSHRTDEEEFYSLEPTGPTLQSLKDRYQEFLTMYNTKRPHWGLKGLTPQEALAKYS